MKHLRQKNKLIKMKKTQFKQRLYDNYLFKKNNVALELI